MFSPSVVSPSVAFVCSVPDPSRPSLSDLHARLPKELERVPLRPFDRKKVLDALDRAAAKDFKF